MENAYTSQKLLEVFKKDKTYENAKNYIISFICEYTGKQGYYDYYKLNNEETRRKNYYYLEGGTILC